MSRRAAAARQLFWVHVSKDASWSYNSMVVPFVVHTANKPLTALRLKPSSLSQLGSFVPAQSVIGVFTPAQMDRPKG